MSDITHKKLLTFSNLTNLEWQFARYKNESNDENSIELDTEGEEYKKLQDLLTPESFAKRNEKGEVEDYTYMDGVSNEEEITPEIRKQGEEEMRQTAGLGMEYKDSNADFMSNWEVIYGADNYKIVKDIMDGLFEAQHGREPKEGEQAYPQRESVEEADNKIQSIQLTQKLIDESTDVVSALAGIKYGDAVELLADTSLDKVEQLIYNNTGNQTIKQLEESVQQDLNLATFKDENITDFNQNWVLKILKQRIDKIEENGSQYIKNKSLELPPLVEKFDMLDTGLKVVAYQNGDDIVISYNKTSSRHDKEKELLPKEKNLLRWVAKKIIIENPDAKVTMTGLNRGADFACLNSIIYDSKASLFYTRTPGIKDYLSYTIDDLNSEYETVYETVTSQVHDFCSPSTGISLIGAIAEPATLIFTFGLTIVNIIDKYIDSLEITKDFNKYLVERWRFIRDDDNIKYTSGFGRDHTVAPLGNMLPSSIKGKINSKNLSKKYVNIPIENRENLKLKTEDSLYILKQGIIDNLKDVNSIVRTTSLFDPNNYFRDSEEKKVSQKLKQLRNKSETTIDLKNSGSDQSPQRPEKLYELSKKSSGYEISSIYKIEYSEDINTNKITKIADITEQKFAGKAILNKMLVINEIQETFLEEKRNEFFDNKSDYEYIYPKKGNKTEPGQEDIYKEESILGFPEKLEYRSSTSNLSKDEYTFAPYLNKDGMLKNKAKLNKAYKRKVLEGMLVKALIGDPKELELLKYSVDSIPIRTSARFIDWLREKVDYDIGETIDLKGKSPKKLIKEKLVNFPVEKSAGFHYYRKVYDLYENNKDKYIDKIYSLERKGPERGEIIFNNDLPKNKIEYLYSSSYIFADFTIPVQDLKDNFITYLEGSQIFSEEGKAQTLKLSPDTTKVKDSSKYNPDSTIKISGQQIGQGIKKIEDKNRLYQENQEYLEEYQETLKTDDKEQQDIKVRYIYKPQTQEIEFTNYSEDRFEKPYPVLMLRYGYGQSYDYVMTIAYFKDQDFGIDLPRKHKHKGSHNDKISEQFQINYACQPVSTHVNRKKSGSSQTEIFLDDLNREKSLGENIALIQEIKKKDTTIYRFAEPGKDTISAEETKLRKLNNDLKPDLFEREYYNPGGDNEKEPIYGGNGSGNCDYDKGKKEMRREAGIGMEYRELYNQGKNDEKTPGDFMKDWEVIYGADNYKIVA